MKNKKFEKLQFFLKSVALRFKIAITNMMAKYSLKMKI